MIKLGKLKSGHIWLSCPFSFNGKLDKYLPDRSFLKSRRVWKIHLTRQNLINLRKKFVDHPKVSVEDGVLEIIDKRLSSFVPRSESKIDFPELTNKIPFDAWAIQKQAMSHCYPHKHSILDMDMGMGKSFISINVMLALFENKMIDTFLIVTPVSTIYNWEYEIKKFLPNSNVRVWDLNNTRKSYQRELFDFKNHGNVINVYICGSSSFSVGKHMKQRLDKVVNYYGSDRMGMIIDEAHYFKNADSDRSKFLLEHSVNFAYKIAMTGTPIANKIVDYHGICNILDPDIVGLLDKTSFERRYCIKDEFTGVVIGYKNQNELLSLISPYVFQARKRDHMKDLPPTKNTKIFVDLTPEQAEINEQLKNGFLEWDNQIEDIQMLPALTKMQQVAGGFIKIKNEQFPKGEIKWLIDPFKSPKFKKIEELLESIDGKVIIWCKYTEVIIKLNEFIQKIYGPDSVSLYYGALDVHQREDSKELFVNGPAKVFLSNPACGGTGLNGLTVSSYAIYFDNSFMSINRYQSMGRLDRPGQMCPVDYIDLVTRGSIDNTILRALSGNKDLLDYVRECIQHGRDVSFDD